MTALLQRSQIERIISVEIYWNEIIWMCMKGAETVLSVFHSILYAIIQSGLGNGR